MTVTVSIIGSTVLSEISITREEIRAQAYDHNGFVDFKKRRVVVLR
jgi:hypothetical protein